MPSKNKVHETDDHLDQRWFLIELEESIAALKKHKHDASWLKEFNSSSPAPRPNLPQPSDEILKEACAPDSPAHSDPFSLAYNIHLDWSSYAFHQLNLDDYGPWRSKE
ncbi:hypothetical protein N7455_011956 [Penicillium solitum]|uniref:uncharacterized protein n=1 Tax=Penicillium solitum TaxID=60172 RepID=UPI0032C45409|nr:hypothetical protein N7455_011956 [Penicillium solitum]